MTVALPVTGAAARAGDLLDLTKPRLSLLVLASAAVGMIVAPAPLPPLPVVAAMLLGTAAVIGGANAFNCVLERDTDRLMARTRSRPLPSGRLKPLEASVFAAVLCLGGLLLLRIGVHPLAAGLAAFALLAYVLAYTPLKRRTSFCTVVGAVPGAIPPMIGWATATGGLEPGAWVLFAAMFLWQPAHFLALAWLYREDYRRAGLPMLPVEQPDGRRVAAQMVGWFVALAPVSALVAPVSRAGTVTLALAPLMALALAALALPGVLGRASDAWARRCFLASVVQMTLWLAAMVLDAALALPA